MASGKRETGVKGVPQGGLLSPILSNIYLHGFDIFVEGLIKKASSGGPTSVDNPEYKATHTKVSNKRQSLGKTKNEENKKALMEEIQALEKERAKLPSKKRNPISYQA